MFDGMIWTMDKYGIPLAPDDGEFLPTDLFVSGCSYHYNFFWSKKLQNDMIFIVTVLRWLEVTWQQILWLPILREQ